MIVFTVVEGKRIFLPAIEQDGPKNERSSFRFFTNLFSFLFFVFAALRTLFVFTVLVALFNNEPDLTNSWNSGYGFLGLILYIFASAIDFLRLLNIAIAISVIVGLFSIGNGFGSNFTSFALPIILAYGIVFLLVLGCNFIYNAIIEKMCPMTYHMISLQMGVGTWNNESASDSFIELEESREEDDSCQDDIEQTSDDDDDDDEQGF